MPDPPLFQHPLAYLLGLEGIALLQAFSGEYDEAFTRARIAEIRQLLTREEELGDGVEVPRLRTVDAYADWAPFYDSAQNQMVAVEQPAVWEILERLPVGDALDAACGTGRHAARLMELGHRVTGVDASVGMLAVARQKLPGVELLDGDLRALPVAAASMDTVVCGLALMHVPELVPVLAQFARVLRPGGHLVLSDWQAISTNPLEPFVQIGRDGADGYAEGWSRSLSEYLSSALELGFELRGIAEIPGPRPLVDAAGVPSGDSAAPLHEPGRAPNRWALHRFAPEATNAAYRYKPLVRILHLQLRAGGPA